MRSICVLRNRVIQLQRCRGLAGKLQRKNYIGIPSAPLVYLQYPLNNFVVDLQERHSLDVYENIPFSFPDGCRLRARASGYGGSRRIQNQQINQVESSKHIK